MLPLMCHCVPNPVVLFSFFFCDYCFSFLSSGKTRDSVTNFNARSSVYHADVDAESIYKRRPRSRGPPHVIMAALRSRYGHYILQL